MALKMDRKCFLWASSDVLEGICVLYVIKSMYLCYLQAVFQFQSVGAAIDARDFNRNIIEKDFLSGAWCPFGSLNAT